MSTSVTRRKVKASRDRNDNGKWGWQPSSFSNRLYKKLERDVARGILPKSCLSTTITIGKVANPKHRDIESTPRVKKPGMLKRLTGILRGSGSRGE